MLAQESNSIQKDNLSIELPDIIVENISQDIIITIKEHLAENTDSIQVSLNGEIKYYPVNEQQVTVSYDFPKKETLEISTLSQTASIPIHPIPLWMSILPPLFAIFFALLLREVYSALFIGLWIGTGILYYYKGVSIFVALFQGFLAIFDTYILDALNDTGHLSIILFSMIIAATVSIITKNGGMKGVVNRLSTYVKDARSASIITWLLGILIFFDDY